MQPLTKRQREIYDYIARSIRVNGYAPTFDEIRDAFGLLSLATVHKHVSNLQEKRYIVRSWNRTRSITLIPQTPDGCCPTCGAKITANSTMKVKGEGVESQTVGEGSAIPTPT